MNAVVVGGGPAGASAALGLIRCGFDVTLLEKRTRWTGRVCGSFLDFEAVSHLRWLGLWDEVLQAGAVPVHEALLTGPSNRKTRMEMLHGGQPSFGLPRRDLEDLLLRAVRNAGGRVEMGVHVRSFEKKGADWILGVRQMSGLDLTAGASIPPNAQERACSLLVLADGRLSMIQNIPPHSPPRIGRSCYGWNVAFENVPQAPGDLSMHFYPGGYVGVMTFSTGESNVSGIVFTDGPPPRPWSDAFKAAQERQPSLRRLLRDARPVGEWHGVGPLPFTTRMRPDQGAFLAGDAAAVGDPFMGEGIGRALGAGPLLYECFRNAQNRSLEQIRQNYRQRWTNLYSARLRLGWVLRETLRRPILAARATGFLLQNDWSIRALLPLFHRGFSSPPI